MTTITEEATEVQMPKFIVEREDDEDGSIDYHVFQIEPEYRWVVTFNDHPERHGKHAKSDAEIFVRNSTLAPQAEGRDTGLPYAFITCNSEIDKFYVSIKTQTLADAQRWHDAVLGLASSLSPKEPEPIWGKPLTFDEPPLGFNPHSGSEGGGWDEDDEPEYRSVMRENGE